MEPLSGEVAELIATMARLRGPDGCPWDREQTHRSLKRYLLEETYETLEAIDGGNAGDLQDELADLLLQVVFHAQMAQEAGNFSFGDIVRHLLAKLKRRHPHIFGTVEVDDAAQVPALWQSIKAAERPAGQPPDLLATIPRALPALHRAQRLQEKAAQVGFDWPDVGGAMAKLEEEVAELASELMGDEVDIVRVGEELGDALFSAVNVARKAGLVAFDLLGQANRRFSARFGEMERAAGRRGAALSDLDLGQLEGLWQSAKGSGPDKPPVCD